MSSFMLSEPQTRFADKVRATSATITGFLFALIIAVLPASGQAVGDSVVIQGENLRAAPGFGAEQKGYVEDGTRGVITAEGPQDEYFRVNLGQREGWIFGSSVVTLKFARKVQKAKEEGYTVFLVRQSVQRSPYGGIDVALGVINVSQDKTVKYIDATWQLFNPVGDPVETGLESSTAETRLVGPIEPRDTGASTFEDVWNSDVGECAVLKKLVVRHIDGSSFTYINDLKDIAMEDSNVRLRGDCSYEAQQERKN